jgi:DNA-binding MarR family transcriptional regulator
MAAATLIQRLKRGGPVVRVQGAGDQRAVLVRRTEQDRSLLEQLDGVMVSADEEALRASPPSRQTSFAA